MTTHWHKNLCPRGHKTSLVEVTMIIITMHLSFLAKNFLSYGDVIIDVEGLKILN